MRQQATDELERQLEQLVREERALSAQRRRLQDRIDLFLGGGAPQRAAEDEMAELRRRERELSERRRELHERIDHVRARLSHREPA